MSPETHRKKPGGWNEQDGARLPPLAINGYSLHLPGDITTGEQLFELVAAKRQMRRDAVAGGRYPASMVAPPDAHGSNPWLLNTGLANLFTDEEAESYDYHLFRVTQKMARYMDIRQIGVLQSVWRALEDAGIPAEQLYRTRTGVFVAAYVQVKPAIEAPDETMLRGSLMSSLSDHVAFFLGTHGPSVTLETACSSSLVALAVAASSLRKGECDTAIVAAANIPQEKDFHLSLQACGVLSVTGTSHPFDEAGPKGYVRAEGFGAIVLRRLDESLAAGDRVLCTLRNAVAGAAGAAEGVTSGPGRMYESPCAYGMVQLMSRAYEEAGLDPANVDYMECHATGTQVGDRIELEAVGRVLGASRGNGAPPLRVASVKSNIGHAETAAGLFSLAKAIEMLRRRVYLPSAGVTAPRSDFDWHANNMRVIQESEPFGDDARPRLIGINSFGIGGSYGHTIVEEFQQQQRQQPLATQQACDAGALLFPLSAAGPVHLKQHARQLAAYARALDAAGGSALDMCGTMAAHRSQLQHRTGVVVSGGLPDLAQQLEELASGPDVAAPESAPSRRILFVFTGQGAQWQGVGETLMDLPPYRDAVHEVDRLFHQQSGWSILDKAHTLPPASLRETQYAQPLTLMVQVGLVRLLDSFGLTPHIVVGHSAGEVASAWAAGLLTLEEAVAVAACRSAEQQKLAGCGRLLAVGLGQEELLGLLSDLGLAGDVEVACINSPQSTVLAGTQEALDAAKAALPGQTFCAFVPGNIAFHSSRMEPILPEVRRRLAFLDAPSRGKRPAGAPVFVSTVTGEEQISAGADYWANNILSPVAFERAVATIFADEETAPDLVIEIGPHKTLADPLLQTTKALGLDPVVLPTLRRGGDCRAVLTQLLASLFDRGLNLAPPPFFRSLGYRRLDDLPLHPFLKTRMHELAPIHRYEAASGLYLAGPVAGSFKAGAHEVEVCDRTFKTLTDHKMGGVELVPGAFYMEMAIEATARETGFPVVLANIEFKTMCRIPHSSAGEPAALLTLAVQGEGDARAFAVRSTPARGRLDEPPSYTEHCTGLVLSSEAAASVTTQNPDSPDCGLQPGAFGLLAPFELRDVGPAGLAALRARHAVPLASSREQFYGLVNKEGLSEYGPTFQVVTSLHANPVDDTYLGAIDFDSDAWARRGGCFGVPLLDSVLQMLFLLPSHDPQIVTYAGGFEAAYMLRMPTSRCMWAFMDHDSKALFMGRRKRGGDIFVYDEEGRLVFAFKGCFIICGATTDTTRLCDLVWQQRVATAADNTVVEEFAAAGPQVERIAPLVARAARAFHLSAGAVGGPRPTVFRVLEVVEDGGSPTLAEALSRLELDPGRIIEVYVGSHSTEVLSRAATNIDHAGEGLRVRKVLMPALPRELPDVTFDVIALHGWTKSGHAPWEQEGPGGAARAVAAALGSFLSPGALLLALGTEGEETDEWAAALQPAASHVAAAPGAVAARLDPPRLAEPRSYLVVAEDANAGAHFAERLIAAAGPQCAASVLTTGPAAAADLPDGASASEWAAALATALRGPAGAAFRGIVFMGSLDDDTLLGTKGFGRLAKLCQAATVCEADVTAALGGGGADGHLWVLTEGVFGGDPRPNQGTIQGLAAVMCHELGSLETRLVDLATGAPGTTRGSALAEAAAVVAASPREKVYRVSAAGIEVPRYMPIDTKARSTRLVSPADPGIAYCCDVTGDLVNPGRAAVEFAARPLGPPGEGQVVVDLQAAALNFRDVMIAINMLPDLSFQGSYYGRHLGMEASGVVSAVGPGVTHLRVGDRVATAEPYCFGNRLIAPADRAFKLPDCISFEVAASVQSVYNTAHHALVNVGRIKAGDTVLIHAAAGGVGHAAISVCRHLGATVYATASAAKRDAVRAMGVAHVYDSRSTSWFTDLMRDTAGRGVDAVLNSLAGQHQRLGLQALAPGGRFLEIGKMDIYENAKLGSMALRKNGVFAALDMDRLAADDPALTAATTSEVFRLLAAGVYHPLPVTSFPMDRIRDAIELVKTGGHIGKVVLTNYTPDGEPVPVRVLAPPPIFRPDVTYLITGAAGGFGSKLVRAAFEGGARHFVITVTRDPVRAEALFGDIIATPGASLEVLVADTASESSVEEVVRRAASGKGRPPLRAIFHVAGISTDTLLTEVTPEDLIKVAGCKALGAYYLHKHTEHIPLDTFCVISSVASFLGGRGRAAYSAANAFCDALIRVRRARGLPGSAFNMTSLSDVGILAQDVAVRQIQMRSNVEFVRSVRALQDLEATLACGLVQGCELFFRETAVGVYPNRSNYFHGGRAVFTLGTSAGRAARGAVGAQEVQALILEAVEAVLGHGDVSGSSALFSIGLDSFSSVELLARIKEMFGVDVPPSKMGPATTVADLTRLVTGAQAGAGGDAAGGASGPAAPAEAVKPASVKAAAKARPPTVAPQKTAVIPAVKTAATATNGVNKADKAPQEQRQVKQWQKQQEGKNLKPLVQKLKRPSPMAAIRSLLNKRYGTGAEGERLSVPVGLLGLDRLRVTRPVVDDAEARRWLNVPLPRPGARSRLLCLPWAGGTTQVFGWLAEALAPIGVEVVIVVPPGRDTRAAEPLLVDVRLVAEAVAKAAARMGYLRPGAPPLSLLGASYGSYVVLDVARLLKQQYGYSVDQLYVSSACPPAIKRWIIQYSFGSSWIVHNLLGRLGGLPDEYKAFQSTTANRRATRATRLDLGAMDFYSFPRGRVLDCPVHVIFGDQDWLTPPRLAIAWSRMSSASTSVKLLRGCGHLYLLEKGARPEVEAYLRATLLGGRLGGSGGGRA